MRGIPKFIGLTDTKYNYNNNNELFFLTMAQTSTLPRNLMTCSLLHFEQGVPIDDLNIRTEHKRRLARVSHVYWIWKKNPFLDAFAMFKQLTKGKGADVQSEWRMAQKDKWLFDFVIEHVAPPSRRVAEEKVRAAADHLMRMGMETDNGRDIAEGAKITMKLERLEQPESEQADLSKTAFLPSVVVTDIREVDDTKENVDDEETRRIMSKYGGFVDEKRTMVDRRVDAMMAGKEAEEPLAELAESEEITITEEELAEEE